MDQHNPFGFIREGKIYRNAFLDFSEREIGEVRESEASTIKYFEDRFIMAENKVTALERAVEESENKGSYLMKLIHMRDHLANFDALGDYESLFKRLDILEEKLRDIIAKNRVKNLEIKRALVAEAEQHEHSTDWKEASDKLAEIKNKWIKTGAVEEEYQAEVEGRFQEILDNFYQRRKAFFMDRKQLVKDRIYKYRGLIFAARRLQRMEDRYEAMDKAKKLQAEWKDIGKIPSFKYNQLFKEFRSTVGQVFKPTHRPQRPSGGYTSGGYSSGGHSGGSYSSGGYSGGGGSGFRRSNWQGSEDALKRKQELIDQVRRLEDDENPVEAIKQLRLAWKNSGMVSRDLAYDLNNRFNQACNMVNEKSFLNRLARAKNPDFDTLSEKEKVSRKINLLQNLIVRDEKDLDLYKENIGKFPVDTGNVDSKLRIQQTKVIVKKKLLADLQEQLKQL